MDQSLTPPFAQPPAIPVKRRIKRFAPLQLAKMLGILYGIFGLIAAPFFGLLTFFTALAPQAPNRPAMPAMPFLGFGLLGLTIILPLMYAALGFIGGLISAGLYNVIATWVGGIEVEVE